MEYQLLGPMAVSNQGVPLVLGGFRQRAVLAVLLLSADRPVDIDTLIELVWDDSPPPKPVSSLRAYVANLRRILTDPQISVRKDRLVTDAAGYRLVLGSDVLDTHTFESGIGHGKRLLDAGDATGAARVLGDALSLWRGSPLSDFRAEQFAAHEIHRLEALRADAVEVRYEAELLRGHSAELIAGLEAEVAVNPLRERLWGQLMLALFRAGRRADALATYERLQVILDQELGVGPGAALEQLATRVREESAELLWWPTVSPTHRQVLRRRPDGSLFGRSRELTRLHDAVTSAADGRGGIAVLTGESGVGKTALASTVADLADDLGVAAVWVGHAGGVRTPPSWAWGQVLRGLAARVQNHRGTGVVSALPQMWERQAPATETTFDLIEATVAAVADLVAHAPAVIVLDDLHRADTFTHDVLQLLATTVHRMPLLVVVTWPDGAPDRPLREADFDRLLSRCEVNSIRLRGIDSAATTALIATTTGVSPTAQLVSSIAARTGGNPFYIKELTRLLQDNGQLDDATVDIATDQVPDAVSGVIRRRMAGLPHLTRKVLATAAVLGSEFAALRVALVADTPVADVIDGLRPAVRAGLVADMPGPAGNFRFSHGLVRDAIAAQLDNVARARLDATIARTCAADDASADDVMTAAEHAWRAGVELDALTAVTILSRAVTVAWGHAAYRDVAEMCRRAIEISERLPVGPQRTEREAELWLQVVSVEAVTRGQNSAEVRAALARANTVVSQAGHLNIAAAYRCLEASGSGRYHEAEVLADGLITVYEGTRDPVAGSAGYYMRALVDFFRGRLGAALGRISALHNEIPAVDWQRHGHMASFDVRGYGIAVWAHGVNRDAVALRAAVDEGLSVADARNDQFGRAIIRISELQAQAINGVHIGAAELAEQVYAELTGIGVDQLAASALIIGGWAAALGPDFVDTVEDVRAAIETHAQDGTRIFLPLYYALLSDIEAVHRDITTARSSLHKAELIATATGERVWDSQLSARKQSLRADNISSGVRL